MTFLASSEFYIAISCGLAGAIAGFLIGWYCRGRQQRRDRRASLRSLLPREVFVVPKKREFDHLKD